MIKGVNPLTEILLNISNPLTEVLLNIGNPLTEILFNIGNPLTEILFNGIDAGVYFFGNDFPYRLLDHGKDELLHTHGINILSYRGRGKSARAAGLALLPPVCHTGAVSLVTVQKERLLAALSDLERIHEEKRAEAAKTLEALEAAQNRARLRIRKTWDLFRYLTWKQQETINGRFLAGVPSLEEIGRRAAETAGPGRGLPFPALEQIAPVKPSQTLRRINMVRKNIVQFGVIQRRAEELAGAVTGALAAFERQYKNACRDLFPLGFLSRLWRALRRFLSRPYFSWRDLGPLRDLGMAAGFILKMAEAPVV